MKLGRTFPGGARRRRAGRRAATAGSTSSARAPTSSGGAAAPRSTAACPYMSLVLVPAQRWPRRVRRRFDADSAHAGTVSVVGLGPAGPEWLTPEAHAELAAADVLIGYDDVSAPRTRAPRPASATRPTTASRLERAQHALALARRRRAGRGRLLGRSRDLRDGGGGARGRSVDGPMAPRARRGVEVRIVPGAVGDAGGRRARRRAARPRLLRDLAVGSAQAVGGDRAAAGGGRRRRPRARALQPGLADPARAARPRGRGAARATAATRPRSSSPAPSAPTRRRSRSRRSSALDVDTVDMRTLLIVGSSMTRTRRRAQRSRARVHAASLPGAT